MSGLQDGRLKNLTSIRSENKKIVFSAASKTFPESSRNFTLCAQEITRPESEANYSIHVVPNLRMHLHSLIGLDDMTLNTSQRKLPVRFASLHDAEKASFIV